MRGVRSSEDRGTGHKAGVVVGAPFWRQHAVRQTGARQRRQPLAAGGAALAGRGPRPRTGVRRPQDDRPWRAGSPLAHADLPWLALVILCGGAIALVLLIWPASLLLNLEGLATLAIAWLVFRENVDRRLLVGAAALRMVARCRRQRRPHAAACARLPPRFNLAHPAKPDQGGRTAACTD